MTLVVILLDRGGVFGTWNEQLLDYEQRIFPRNVSPMDERIVMVDIDDRALERLGRWPWPRTDLADAIAELRRAGAATIAVDLDLADPQKPTVDVKPPHEHTDHDSALARAIDDHLVLGVLLMPDELQARWTAAGGSGNGLTNVLKRLRENLSWDPTSQDNSIRAADRAAASNILHLLRRRAIHDLVATGANRDTLLLLARSHAGSLEPTIDAALLQTAGRGAVPASLPHPRENPPTAADRFAIPSLAGQSSAAGYVNIVRRGHDGGIRHLTALQPIGYGRAVLPLGLAAAARYLHIPVEEIVKTDDILQIGDVQLPLLDDAVTVSWPRTIHGMKWPDLHRGESDERFAGHLSIGEIIMLGRSRRLLTRQRQLQREATADVLPVIRGVDNVAATDLLSPEIQTEIAGEVDFSLGDIGTQKTFDQELGGADDFSTALMQRLLDWRLAKRGGDESASRIAVVEQALRDRVANHLVFIGWTGTGTTADFIPTAVGARTPGVMVHAAMADMVLQNRTLQELPSWWPTVIAAVLGLLIALITATMTTWPATLCSLLIGLGWLGAAIALFSEAGLVVPLAAPLVTSTMSWAGGTAARAVVVQREKRRISRQFRARVPEALVDELSRDPDALSMRGVRREVCVMFGDLAGFTTISERLGSEETVALLNTAMAGLTRRVTSHGAYLNKFLGDGFLAFWSAFGEQADQANLACLAALECQQFMDEMNNTLPKGGTRLGLRIGIATGEAIVGDCGAPPHLNDYTVIGDVANLSARLESANKQFGTAILLDGRTRELLGDNASILEVGPIQVVGRESVVDAWTMVTPVPDPEVAASASDLASAIRSGNRQAATQAMARLQNLQGDSPLLGRLQQVIDIPGDMPTTIRLADK